MRRGVQSIRIVSKSFFTIPFGKESLPKNLELDDASMRMLETLSQMIGVKLTKSWWRSVR
jgi:hypothetical protein